MGDTCSLFSAAYYLVVVNAIAKRIDGQQVEARRRTQPKAPLLELYKKLDWSHPTKTEGSRNSR